MAFYTSVEPGKPITSPEAETKIAASFLLIGVKTKRQEANEQAARDFGCLEIAVASRRFFLPC